MLRSFHSLALRQLRTRPLRSALTTFGIVLGVGMVFGVLLLVGTIRATFDEVIDSAWGKTDLIVMGQGNGTMPDDAVDRIKAVEGVHDAAGMVGGIFTRLRSDGSPVEGNQGQMLVAGYEPEGYKPYDFRVIEGRNIRSGVEVMVERNWASDRGYDVGDRVAVAGPTGRIELPIIGSSASRGDRTSAVSALRRCRSTPPVASSTSRGGGCRSRSWRSTAARSAY